MSVRYVGSNVSRREDPALVRGRAQFVDDIEPSGALYARFVRSNQPHAIINRIDASAASKAQGVVAVITANDLRLPDLVPPVDNPDTRLLGSPILAHDCLRFVGDPYALVLATDPYAAEDAADLVDIDATPLGVVIDPLSACMDDAQLLHAQLGTNVLFEKSAEYGSVDEAFAQSPIVLERRIRSPRQTALPMEPRGMVVTLEGNKLRVYSSTQVPHMLRDAIAEALGIRKDDVSVTVPAVGGGFGLKAEVYSEEIAIAAASRITGKPVKWIEDRADNLTSSCHARDQIVDVRVAADTSGILRALDIDLVCDVGAYGLYSHGAGIEASATPTMIPGPYRLKNYRYRSRAVATNKCPSGAYRGVGLPVATLVHERVVNIVARAAGLDCATVRKRNFITTDEMPYTSVTGQRYDSGDYLKALDAALEAVDYGQFAAMQRDAFAHGRLIGLGIASFVEYSAVGSSVFEKRGMHALKGFDEVRASIDRDGHVTLRTTLPASGQGVETTFAQLAADQLDVNLQDITIMPVDTEDGLDGNGTFGSRSATTGGAAIIAVCKTLTDRLLEDASSILEVAAADLVIAGGAVTVAGAPDSCISIGQIVAQGAPGRYCVDQRYDPVDAMYPYGTHACVIEIDVTTGRPRILRYVAADDNGRPINPMIVAGQIRGAVAQGLAGALYECFTYDSDGQPITTSLMDYLVPTASELPDFELHHIEMPTPDSPSGAKGVGESGTLPAGAAVANAIEDALDAECNELPVSSAWALRTAEAQVCRVRAGVLPGGT